MAKERKNSIPFDQMLQLEAIKTRDRITAANRAKKYCPSQFVKRAYDDMAKTEGVLTTLPEIRLTGVIVKSALDGSVIPYRARGIDLVELYILAYEAKDWEKVDLVTDTFIRALKMRYERGEHIAWQRNEGSAPQSKPDLAPDHNTISAIVHISATNFDVRVIRHLYEYTEDGAGLRRVWADAMALCGERVASRMLEDWPQAFIIDAMKSSMQGFRKEVTFSIEEDDSAKWCGRYHEHSKHGKACYRMLAARVENDSLFVGEDEV
jgi:hypothetical protein